MIEEVVVHLRTETNSLIQNRVYRSFPATGANLPLIVVSKITRVQPELDRDVVVVDIYSNNPDEVDAVAEAAREALHRRAVGSNILASFFVREAELFDPSVGITTRRQMYEMIVRPA